MTEHFPGCHPEDDKDPRGDKPSEEIENPEPCWHCGTSTPRGCHCWDCEDAGVYMDPEAIYHCSTCGRFWAYMTGLNITTITFGAPEEN